MSRFTYPALAAFARALLTHRAATAKHVSHWQNSKFDPHAAELGATCIAELAAIDAALQELQAAAPPYLSDFLKQQIDLIHPPAPAVPPSNQEAA